MSKIDLFTEKPRDLNEVEELIGACPDKFKEYGNPWTRYAIGFKYLQESTELGVLTENWKWRAKKLSVREHQFKCFKKYLYSYGLKYPIKKEYMDAIAGWMLSKMLKKIPQKSTDIED